MTIRRVDLTGAVFSDALVLAYSHTTQAGRAYWQCRCKCGELKLRSSDNLKHRKMKCKRGGCKKKSIADYLKDNVSIDYTSGCWDWALDLMPNGYGRVYYNLKRFSAHRLSYEAFVGEIPDNLFVCHTCDNRKCINPEHLFLGTAYDNMKDMVKKGRSAFGRKQHSVKLHDIEVREIIKLHPPLSFNEIAKIYAVSKSTIYSVINNRHWKHIAWV